MHVSIRASAALGAASVVAGLLLTAPFVAAGDTADRRSADAMISDAEYPHGDFRVECSQCHTPDAWSPIRSNPGFDHSRTGFALLGAHASAECLECHQSLEFEAVSAECASCHVDVHKGEFGAECGQCHGPRSFVDRTEQLAMHRLSQFPLTGSHGTLDCDQCHRSTGSGLDFVTTPTECYSCHQTDYASAASPDHVRSGFSTDCTECHGTVSWIGGDYAGAHQFFPLSGGHAGLDCEQCHAGGRFAAVDKQCVSCHRAEYDGSTDPAHLTAGFGTECAACHTVNSWRGASFDHASSQFPLTGAHRAVDCSDCHLGGSYRSAPTDCNGCHQADYIATTNPPHASAGFGTDCEDCHKTNVWEDSDFDHSLTSFELTGAHRAASCGDCHTQALYSAAPSDCHGCHQSDYSSASDPDHMAAGFSVACGQCHSTVDWTGASFDHDLSRFPLTGAHRAVECQACHTSGVYAGTPSDCHPCHRADYEATADPNHRSAGFGTDCLPCHSTTAWVPGTFDHDLTAFALTGAHRATECTLCHVGGVYAGTTSDCHACHSADYDATTSPAHATAGFGVDCASCHGTATWTGATFDHDSRWFPINSGAHRGRWQECSDCHPNSSNYAVFDCLNCHPHDDKARVDADHRGENGYRYASEACYDCHPRGRE
jgi:hypothetical protein